LWRWGRLGSLVVGGAEERGVVEAGGSALLPGGDVVGVAVAGIAVAAGEHTSPVAQDDGLAEVTGEQPGGATEVEDRRVAAHDGGEDVGVTREPAGFTGTDAGVRAEEGRAGNPAEQIVVGDQDGDAGSVAAGLVGVHEGHQRLRTLRLIRRAGFGPTRVVGFGCAAVGDRFDHRRAALPHRPQEACR